MLDPYKKPWPYQKVNTAHPFAKGLVGCWVMNERSGDKIHDSSGNNHIGTFEGNVLWDINRIDLPGAVGDRINCGTGLNSILANNDFTAVAKIYPRASAAYDTIIGNYESGDPWVGFSFGLGSSTNLSFWNGTAWDASGINAYSLNEWVTVAITLKGTSLIYYINGTQFDTDVSGHFGVSSANLYIGDVVGNDAINAKMEYVYVYNRALTLSEIAQLYIDPYYMFKPYFDPILMAYVAAAGGLSIPIAMHLKITENISATGSGLKGNVIC